MSRNVGLSALGGCLGALLGGILGLVVGVIIANNTPSKGFMDLSGLDYVFYGPMVGAVIGGGIAAAISVAIAKTVNSRAQDTGVAPLAGAVPGGQKRCVKCGGFNELHARFCNQCASPL